MDTREVIEYQATYNTFMMREAQWLDSIVKPYVPGWIVKVVLAFERSPLRLVALCLHYLVDKIWISWVLRIDIKRNMHHTMVGGKGFRPQYGKQRLDSISTTVFKAGKEIAKQTFPIGVNIS